MKIPILKNNHSLIGALILVFFLLVSCEKEATSTTEIQETTALTDLPEKVIEQLEGTRENLKQTLGDDLLLVSYEEVASVAPSGGAQLTSKELSAPTSTIALGNIKDAATIQIGQIADFHTSKESLNSAQKSIQNKVLEQISDGDRTLKIVWNYKNVPYESLAYFNESGLVWDNFIFGLISMETIPEKIKELPEGIEKSQTSVTARVEERWDGNRWTVNWLWGSQRGSMEYWIRIFHENNSVVATDSYDSAFMNIGSAISESKVLVSSGSYGQIRYALGLATPTATLSFKGDTYEVSVTGLGSTKIENGTSTLFP